MARKKMKLFVWEGVLCDHTCGMMVALAHTVEEARAELLALKPGVEDDINEEPEVIELDKPFACYCYGGG